MKSARHDPVQREKLLAVLEREKHKDRIRKKRHEDMAAAQGPRIKKDITMGSKRKEKLRAKLAEHTRVAQEEQERLLREKQRNAVKEDLRKEGKIKIGVNGKVCFHRHRLFITVAFW